MFIFICFVKSMLEIWLRNKNLSFFTYFLKFIVNKDAIFWQFKQKTENSFFW
jgi:hypothetical protein